MQTHLVSENYERELRNSMNRDREAEAKRQDREERGSRGKVRKE